VVVGLLPIDEIRMVPAAARHATRVGDVAICDRALLVDGNMPVETLLALPSFSRVGRAVVVDERGRSRGIVSITDLQRRIRASEVVAPTQRVAA
jgi:predicted transcriptional regulator